MPIIDSLSHSYPSSPFLLTQGMASLTLCGPATMCFFTPPPSRPKLTLVALSARSMMLALPPGGSEVWKVAKTDREKDHEDDKGLVSLRQEEMTSVLSHICVEVSSASVISLRPINSRTCLIT